MNRTELLQKCKEMGIRGVSTKNKHEIEQAIREHAIREHAIREHTIREHAIVQPSGPVETEVGGSFEVLSIGGNLFKELLTTIQRDKPRKVCKGCNELGHNAVSPLCKLTIEKNDKLRRKIKTYILSQNCLEGKTTDDYCDELSLMLGITSNACKTLYLEIPPEEFLDRPLDMDLYFANIRQLSVKCHECDKNMVCIQKNTNRLWKGENLCDACWCAHEYERHVTWYKIKQHRPIRCAICSSRQMCDLERYHYDHLNMFDKSDSVCSMVNDGASVEEICAEIDKCQVLCLPCHHIVTDIEHKLGFTRIKQNLTRRLNQADLTEEEHSEQMEILQKAYEDKMRSVYEDLKAFR